MNEKDAYIEHLENTIKDLQNQVSNLTEMVLLLRKERVYWKTDQDETVLLQLLQDHLWIYAYQCDRMRCRCFQQQ